MKKIMILLSLSCIAIHSDDRFGADLSRRYGVNGHIPSATSMYFKRPNKKDKREKRTRRKKSHRAYPSTMSDVEKTTQHQ